MNPPRPMAVDALESSEKSNIPCLVCRSRKVRCDKTLPECRNCERLGVKCPRYNVDTQTISRSEIQKSAEDIFKASGVEKRRVGSCEECRGSKHRCTRTRPSCRRCLNKGLRCVYPDKQDRPDVPLHGMSLEASEPSTPPSALNGFHRQVKHASDLFADIGIELDQLFSETLPDDPTLRLRLVEAYFDRSYPLRCLSFLDKSTFMHSLDRDSVIQDYGQPTLYTMCALGARHIYFDFVSYNDVEQLAMVPGEVWVERARKDVFAEIDNPSVNHVMSMVLLCDYGVRADMNSMVFVLVSFLYRVIRLHGLDKPDLLNNPSDYTSQIRRDTENRLVWACYFVDLFTATGVDRNSCWSGVVPSIPLPLADKTFLPQPPLPQYNLLQAETSGILPVIHDLDLSALSILVIRLRMTGLRLIRTRPEHLDMIISDPASPYVQTMQQLSTIYQHLPERYHLNDTTIPMLQEQRMLGGVFFFHFLMHAVVSDMTRPSLPGFNFPLATAFHSTSADFRTHCQERCRFHARQTSDLIRRGMTLGRVPFDDPYSADAALESMKIQIVYAAAVNQDRNVIHETGENLRTTLGFFDWFNRGKPGPSQYIRTLLPLCFLFGFRDVAEPFRSCPTEDGDTAEVVGSADIDHLSRFAPFRRARSALKSHPGVSSTPTSSSHYAQSTPATQENFQTNQAMPGHMHMDTDHQTLSNLQPDQAFIPVSMDQGLFPTATQPMQIMSHMQPMVPDMMIPQPSMDDYIRTADEMSSYLTWDAMDIPPALDYGNFFPLG